MPTFIIQSEITLTYRHSIVADTLQEAVEEVEDQQDDGVEIDSSMPVATQYTIEGQMGWNDVTDAVRGAEDRFAHSPNNCPSNHWNRGDDICEDCGLNLNE
jgi:CheY-like chemotaxis protein